jgi:hypothetical protein
MNSYQDNAKYGSNFNQCIVPDYHLFMGNPKVQTSQDLLFKWMQIIFFILIQAFLVFDSIIQIVTKFVVCPFIF